MASIGEISAAGTLNDGEARLTASRITTLAGQGAMTFWARYCDPERTPFEPTAAMLEGTAIHKFILEGESAYLRNYAVKPKPADYPDALKTKRDLCEWLDINYPGYQTSGKTNLKIAEAIKESTSAPPRLWPIIMRDFEDKAGSREVISAETDLTARRAAQQFAAATGKPLADMVMPEIPLMWRQHKRLCAARIDGYMPDINAIVEVKTFSAINKTHDVGEAAMRAFINGKHYLQAAFYQSGIAAIAKAGIVVPDAITPLIETGGDCGVLFIYIERGAAPRVCAKLYDPANLIEQTMLAEKAEAELNRAIRRICDVKRPERMESWLDASDIYIRQKSGGGGFPEFRDGEFPPWTFTKGAR